MSLLLSGLAGAQERRPVPAPPAESSAEATAEPLVEVPVEIVVVEGPFRAAVPVPGAVVELGVGLREEAASAFWARPVLARVTADSRGLIRETLAVPEHWLEQDSARIWARVEMPGRTRRTITLSVKGRGGREVERMFVYRGGTVIGTVLDAAGEPVPGAEVSLFRRLRGGLEPRRSKPTDSAGRFALNFAAAGDFDLHARSGGLGSGGVGPIALSLATPAERLEPLEIRLAGGVALAGRVVDPAGHPVPGVTITAVPAAGLPDELQRRAAESRGGLSIDLTRTGLDGRFELPDLVPGNFELHARFSWGSRLASRPRSGHLGESIGFLRAPSAQPADFVLRAQRLEVTVVDAEGERVDVGSALGEPSRGWLRAENIVEVFEDGNYWSRARGFEVENLLVYPVTPDHEYVLTWRDPAVPFFEQSITVDWNQCRIPVTIQLGPRAEPASLTMRVLGPDGRAYAGPFVAPGVEGGYRQMPAIHVRGLEHGGWLATTETGQLGFPADVKDATWTLELPAGHYRIEAAQLSSEGCVVSLPWPRELFVPTAAELELLPGEERTLDLHLAAAGHLDLEPLDPRPRMTAAERRALIPDNVISHEPIAATRTRLHGVSVILVSSSGERAPIQRYDTQDLWDLRYSGLPWIVEGWPARCLSPIAPGTWTLRLERAGELLLERLVTIQPGEVTTVRW